MSEPSRLSLFDAFGVELEYMIVDRETLAVRPIADQLMSAAGGENAVELTFGPIGWSNELVLHVVELKTAMPAPALEPLPALFAENLSRIDTLLQPLGAQLLPTGAHPLMDPATETQLWPHENNEIYQSYDRIFGCHGHGWSNLQSTHINLPFGSDREFAQLHAAIRLVLPLIPALSASTPLFEGQANGTLDRRLEAYQQNQRRIPEIAGQIIPEPVSSQSEYLEQILQPMWRAIAPWDPAGILQHEWLNSRGAIARFERGAIEIRVIDIQECPLADLAILAITVALLRGLVGERWSNQAAQHTIPTSALSDLYQRCLRDGPDAEIDDTHYLSLFGRRGTDVATVGSLWSTLLDELIPADACWRAPLELIISQGPLARRILSALGQERSVERINAVYRRLAQCLLSQEPFTP